MAAKVGDRVQVHYTGSVENTVFDSSVGRDPIEFRIGAGEVLPGFEQAVVGMVVGEKKTFQIPPDQAYGDRVEELVQDVPMDFFEGHPIEVGQLIHLQSHDGQILQALVTDVTEEFATLDMNHPLAGKTLTFEIELTHIEPEHSPIIIP